MVARYEPATRHLLLLLDILTYLGCALLIYCSRDFQNLVSILSGLRSPTPDRDYATARIIVYLADTCRLVARLWQGRFDAFSIGRAHSRYFNTTLTCALGGVLADLAAIWIRHYAHILLCNTNPLVVSAFTHTCGFRGHAHLTNRRTKSITCDTQESRNQHHADQSRPALQTTRLRTLLWPASSSLFFLDT